MNDHVSSTAMLKKLQEAAATHGYSKIAEAEPQVLELADKMREAAEEARKLCSLYLRQEKYLRHMLAYAKQETTRPPKLSKVVVREG